MGVHGKPRGSGIVPHTALKDGIPRAPGFILSTLGLILSAPGIILSAARFILNAARLILSAPGLMLSASSLILPDPTWELQSDLYPEHPPLHAQIQVLAVAPCSSYVREDKNNIILP